MSSHEHNSYLLSRDIEPVSYTIFLEPDLTEFTFKGNESIRILANRPFSKIELHAVDLVIPLAFLYRDNPESGTKLMAGRITTNGKRETVTLDFGQTLKPGQFHYLYLEFEGELNDKMHGFYRTSYFVEGEKRWGAATQFEATDARRCFPCWDEPDRKAEFRVTLRVPNHLAALSNMPVEKESFSANSFLKEITYQPTPIMPTYLVCFVIAELEYVEAVDKNGVLVRVYTTLGKREQGRFALEVALHTLPYFSEWFGIVYGLPKCDMVALPDFSAGAMENWGLITYRETALLIDPENSSQAAKQRVAEVIDHELAHQWFGNLVTMKWWTDLWLNEGFASYMGPKAVAHQFPQWKVWNQYVANEYLGALHADGLKNTHPIEIDVKNPCEIREIFDHITYLKGSVVNRMLEHFLGEEKFRQGLHRYLKQFEYANASTEDLWQALEEVSGKPVKAIMASYTKQPGYPILNVRPKFFHGKAELELEQKRFLFDGSQDRSKTIWQIPIQIASHGSKNHHEKFMESRNEKVILKGGVANGWMKLNPGHSGFYRVAYSPELLGYLFKAVQKRNFSSIDCLGLVDDVFAQARAGHLRTSQGLELLKALKGQMDYNLWLVISGALGGIESVFAGKVDSVPATFARNLFAPLARKIGWNAKPKDSHLDILLRSLVLSNLGHYGDEETIDEARKRFAQFVKTGRLDPNLRGAVYSIVSRYGSSGEFSKLIGLYRKSTLQEERSRLLRALVKFREPAVIREALKFSMSPDVRFQDTYLILGGFGSNQKARDANWKFIKQNWKALTERYSGGAVTMLGHILEGAVSSFNDLRSLEDIRRFFHSHRVPGTERTMKQSLEMIQSNITWRKRDAKDVQQWFSSARR